MAKCKGKPIMFGAIEQTCTMHVKLELAVELSSVVPTVPKSQLQYARGLCHAMQQRLAGLAGLQQKCCVHAAGLHYPHHQLKVSGMQPALSTRGS